MIQYVYIVKCPECEDEFFDFFDDAKAFATGCLSKQPIITQVEVARNDFGECTDSCGLGTIWSWEDMMSDIQDNPSELTFSKKDTLRCFDGNPETEFDEPVTTCATDIDPEFDNLDNSLDEIPDNFRKPGTPIFEENQVLATNKRGDFMIAASSGFGYTVFNRSNVCIGHIDSETDEDAIRRFNLGDLDEAVKRKPVPADMTIKDLVEAMEENEDTVECVCCQELYPKEDCKYDEKHGWICSDCQDEVVECTWCEELYDRSECRYEVDLGWLCDRCEAAIKSRGETLTFRENNYWDFLGECASTEEPNNKTLKESRNEEQVDFDYEGLDVTLTGGYHSGGWTSSGDIDYPSWDEEELKVDFTYSVDRTTVEEAITDLMSDNKINEPLPEDLRKAFDGEVKISWQEENVLWDNYFAEHFDRLVEKYNDLLKEYFEDSAREYFEETYSLDNIDDEFGGYYTSTKRYRNGY